MLCFHTAIVITASLSLDLFPLSDSDSDVPFTTIGPSLLLSLKWVLYPIVSDVAIAIAQWKQPNRHTGNLLKKHRYRCMETGHYCTSDKLIDFDVCKRYER